MHFHSRYAAIAASVALTAALVSGTAASASAAAQKETRMVSVGLDHSSITYGQLVTLSGYLQSKEATPGRNPFNYGPDGVSVTVDAYRSSDCSGTVAASTDATTGSDGFYDGAFSAVFRPTSADPWSYRAVFADSSGHGPTYTGSSSECLPLTVAQARTTTALTSAPTSVTLGSSVDLGYLVESAYGVSDNVTGGSVAVEDISGPGPLCGPAEGGAPVTATQNDADGSGAADAGFSETGTFWCKPAQPGTYTVDLAYSGDHNYAGSTSGQVDITVVATDECPAAPAIAGDYMQQMKVPTNSDLWNTVIKDVAGQTGVNGLLFAGDSCKPDYAGRVTGYIDLRYSAYGL